MAENLVAPNGAIAGVSVLLKVNTGTADVPIWTAVGGQKDCGLKLDSDGIDTSCKNSTWDEQVVGRNKWSMDLDNLYVESDVAYEALENAYFNRQLVIAQMVMPSGKVYQGYARVTLDISAPEKGATTVKTALEGAAALTKVAAA